VNARLVHAWVAGGGRGGRFRLLVATALFEPLAVDPQALFAHEFLGLTKSGEYLHHLPWIVRPRSGDLPLNLGLRTPDERHPGALGQVARGSRDPGQVFLDQPVAGEVRASPHVPIISRPLFVEYPRGRAEMPEG
jgi:hypothetical protein